MNPKSTFNPWPAAITALGLFFLSLTAWSVLQARTGVSAVTDPAYYSHGMKFQETAVERQAAASSGWQLRAAVDRGRLTMQLTDRDGEPIAGASGELKVFAAATGRNHSLALEATAPGQYRAQLPTSLQGTVPASVHFQRAGAQFTQRLQFNLASGD